MFLVSPWLCTSTQGALGAEVVQVGTDSAAGPWSSGEAEPEQL